ncbi:hypothetical protein LCGC14_2145670 [marine sediment metagenome]|uniref:Uncharacterized protein n=1 Tax=marine sediment metagenome TaxID=412755 RepID=A0A0F9DX88_9ZZZZ
MTKPKPDDMEYYTVLGRGLADDSNEDQARVFNAFADEVSKWPDKDAAVTQARAIRSNLTPVARNFFRLLGG